MIAETLLSGLERVLNRADSRCPILLDYERVERHQRRVRDIALYIADELGLSEEQKFVLWIAARFHDYSKATWPADMEYKVLEEFSEYEKYLKEEHGHISRLYIENDLSTVNGQLGPLIDQYSLQINQALEVIELHHADYNTGQDISIEARILRVADSYDAMRSLRFYRSKKNRMMDHHTVLMKLMNSIEKEVDPYIVKVIAEAPIEKLDGLYRYTRKIKRLSTHN